MSNGKTMKASIVRRELVTAGAPVTLPDLQLDDGDSGKREMEERQRCFQRQQMEHGLGGPVPNAALC